jgi:cyclopropane fatty-acyl-phospholipid synthase-like methyltransferase
MIASGEAPRVLDLGCGVFGQSRRLSRLGAEVIAVDKNENLVPIYEAIRRCHPELRLSFYCAKVTEMDGARLGSNFVAIYSQRMLHYLTYWQAKEMLVSVSRLLNATGRLFLSVSGLESELGDSYPHLNRPVADRFSELSFDIEKKHEIRNPVCLYTAVEFQKLLVSAGLEVTKIWKSEFGNVKAICNCQKKTLDLQ